MTTLESIRPYVDQLFDDSEVQEQLRRAGRHLRVARSRAGSAKSKKKAVQDEQLRRTDSGNRLRLLRGEPKPA